MSETSWNEMQRAIGRLNAFVAVFPSLCVHPDIDYPTLRVVADSIRHEVTHIAGLAERLIEPVLAEHDDDRG
jgi:hypothetical protein